MNAISTLKVVLRVSVILLAMFLVFVCASKLYRQQLAALLKLHLHKDSSMGSFVGAVDCSSILTNISAPQHFSKTLKKWNDFPSKESVLTLKEQLCIRKQRRKGKNRRYRRRNL